MAGEAWLRSVTLAGAWQAALGKARTAWNGSFGGRGVARHGLARSDEARQARRDEARLVRVRNGRAASGRAWNRRHGGVVSAEVIVIVRCAHCSAEVESELTGTCAGCGGEICVDCWDLEKCNDT